MFTYIDLVVEDPLTEISCHQTKHNRKTTVIFAPRGSTSKAYNFVVWRFWSTIFMA